MGKVVRLRGSSAGGGGQGLLDDIRDALATTGSAYQEMETLTVTVAEWRQIARTAARQLQRPVRTFVSTDGVHAVLTDWPRDDDEQAQHDNAMRRAVESTAP